MGVEVENSLFNLTIIFSSRCEIEFIRKRKKIIKYGAVKLQIISQGGNEVDGGKCKIFKTKALESNKYKEIKFNFKC